MNITDISHFVKCGCIIRINDNEFFLGFGKRQWIENPIKSLNCFYFPDFFLENKKPWFYHEHSLIVDTLALKSFIKKDVKTSLNFDFENHFKDYFFDHFADVKKNFENQVLKKVVPYVFETANHTLQKDELHEILNRVVQFAVDKPLHVYGFWDENQGVIGASPEILFEYDYCQNKTVRTIACAGTLNNRHDEAMFLNNAKESLEHQIVVDDIFERLQNIGKVSKGERALLKLPRLSHLITNLNVLVEKDFHFMDVIKALHPTPALGASPRIKGLEWLKKYDIPLNRNHYGAPVGCIYGEGKKAKAIVAIRNLQWDSKNIRIGAGCGVVAESVADDEWNEINLKLASIKDMWK